MHIPKNIKFVMLLKHPCVLINRRQKEVKIAENCTHITEKQFGIGLYIWFQPDSFGSLFTRMENKVKHFEIEIPQKQNTGCNKQKQNLKGTQWGRYSHL